MHCLSLASQTPILLCPLHLRVVTFPVCTRDSEWISVLEICSLLFASFVPKINRRSSLPTTFWQWFPLDLDIKIEGKVSITPDRTTSQGCWVYLGLTNFIATLSCCSREKSPLGWEGTASTASLQILFYFFTRQLFTQLRLSEEVAK